MVKYNHNIVNRILSILIFLLVSCENPSTVQDAGSKSEVSQGEATKNVKTEIDQSDKHNSEIDQSVIIRNVSAYRRYLDSYNYPDPEVSLGLEFTNISDKEIKYLFVKHRTKNGVGDYINSNDEFDDSYQESRITGPFKPREKDYEKYSLKEIFELNLNNGEFWWKYENLWRNNNISEVDVLISKIEFMDGSVIQGQGKTYSEIVRTRSYDSKSF